MPQSPKPWWDRASRFGGGVFSLRDGGDDRESVANLVNNLENETNHKDAERGRIEFAGETETQREQRGGKLRSIAGEAKMNPE